MSLPAQSVVTWQVIIYLLHALALGSTLFRFVHRARVKKLGLDDYVAVIPFAFDIMVLVQITYKFQDKFGPSKHIASSFWFNVLSLQTVLWFSRISLVLSVTRIFLPGSPVRRNFFFMALLFFVMYIVNMIQNTLLCRQGHVPEPFWRMPATHCLKTKEGRFPHGIITVAFDIFADVVLVAYPCYVLWKVKLPEGPRRLILFTFASSILTLICALIYLIFAGIGLYMGPSASLLRSVASQIEATVALMICNLLVVASFFYRHIQKRRVAFPGPNGSDELEDGVMSSHPKARVPSNLDTFHDGTTTGSITKYGTADDKSDHSLTQSSNGGFLVRLSELRGARSTKSQGDFTESRGQDRTFFSSKSSKPAVEVTVTTTHA